VGRPRGLRDPAQHRSEARAGAARPLHAARRRAQAPDWLQGLLLIEPKPAEPTKHQYDFDVATVYGFLKANGLEREIKVNVEQNHALLAGHSFEHEIALAQALGVFGSIDMNRGDELLGWDTDQFPNNLPQVALALYQIMKGGGFSSGGLNFDAKLRRQSIARDDLFIAHIGGMDTMARALLAAASIIESGELDAFREARYAGWSSEFGVELAKRTHTLADLYQRSLTAPEPAPVSGRQEELEALVARHIERVR
jgi:xylose isomerase